MKHKRPNDEEETTPVKPQPSGHAIFAAPWFDKGAEYLPTSVRSGRMVAQSTAERDWAESFHAVPIRPENGTGHGAGGLWDHDEDIATKQKAIAATGRETSSRWPHKALGRYDEERVLAFLERSASKLTTREYEVALHFWRGRLSYGQIALKLGCRKERVRECVQDIRRKIGGIKP